MLAWGAALTSAGAFFLCGPENTQRSVERAAGLEKPLKLMDAERGMRTEQLSRHLGHSSLKVTTDIYGHWERAERKLQAARMEGAFPV